MAKTPAWQRKEGQNPKGGLNAKGRASAKAQGSNLKPPVKSGDNPRRASFLARMGMLQVLNISQMEIQPDSCYHCKHGVHLVKQMLRKKQRQFLKEIRVSNGSISR